MNGKAFDANHFVANAYRGTAIVIAAGKWDAPVFSVIVTDEGELCGFWIDPEFRGGKEIPVLAVKAIQEAYNKGIISVSSGYLFGKIHADNVKSVGFCRRIGAHIDRTIIGGEKWDIASWFIEDFMRLYRDN